MMVWRLLLKLSHNEFLQRLDLCIMYLIVYPIVVAWSSLSQVFVLLSVKESCAACLIAVLARLSLAARLFYLTTYYQACYLSRFIVDCRRIFFHRLWTWYYATDSAMVPRCHRLWPRPSVTSFWGNTRSMSLTGFKAIHKLVSLLAFGCLPSASVTSLMRSPKARALGCRRLTRILRS